MAADQRQIARDALAAVLNGTKTETTFDLTQGRVGLNYVGSTSYTLMRTGQATLTINGRPVNTLTLRLSVKGGANSQYDGDWSPWYDPVSHLWVKGHLDLRRGGGGSQVRDFEVTSITMP